MVKTFYPIQTSFSIHASLSNPQLLIITPKGHIEGFSNVAVGAKYKIFIQLHYYILKSFFSFSFLYNRVFFKFLPVILFSH